MCENLVVYTQKYVFHQMKDTRGVGTGEGWEVQGGSHSLLWRSYSRVHVQLVLPTRAGGEVVVPAEDGFRRRYVTAGRDGVVKVFSRKSPLTCGPAAQALPNSKFPLTIFGRFVRGCGIREQK